MNLFLKSQEGLNLPFPEEASLISAIVSAPVRKLCAEAWKSFQSKKYWTSCLCILTSLAYVAGIALLALWLLPALKTMLVAKFAVSPLVAHGICWGLKRVARWGFGRIVEAITRKNASQNGCEP